MLEIKIVQPKDFLNVWTDGHYDFERAKALIEDLARLNQPPHDYAILLDLRGAEGYASTVDLYELACLLNDHRESFRNKIAALVPEHDSRRFANAEFFALTAGNRGFRVRAFKQFEEAMKWLSDIVKISGEMPILEIDAQDEPKLT